MSWEPKYRIGHFDLGGVEVHGYIDEQLFSGALTDLKGSVEPCEIQFDNNSDDIFDPIHPQTLVLQIVAESNFQLAELYSTDQMRYRVRLFTNFESDLSQVYWMGYVDPGRISEPYEPHPYTVNLTCICGLDLLSNIKYFDEVEDSGEYYNGRILESQIILDILSKIGHTGFTEYINLYEDRMNKTTDDSPMDQLLIDVDIFQDMYCDEVLAHLLTKYNAVITQKNGGFIIDRPVDRILATVYGRVFSGDSTVHTSTSFSPIQYISRRSTNLTNFKQVPGGTTMPQDPIKKITIIQDYGNKESWIDNWEFKAETYTPQTLTTVGVFDNWTSVGVAAPALLEEFVPGEKNGMILDGKNAYPTYDSYLTQTFGPYGIVSATDEVIFEFDYRTYNLNVTSINNFVFYIQITNGTHYLKIVDDASDDKYAWDVATGTTMIRVECDGVLPGISDWIHYKRSVVGLPKTSQYTINIFCTDSSGDFNQMYVAYKDIRFHVSSVELLIKPKQVRTYRFGPGVRLFLKTFGAASEIDPNEKRYSWTTGLIKSLKEITTNKIEVFNNINGKEELRSYILGDVVDSGLDNVIEQCAGSLAMVVTQGLEQAAGDFVAAYADDYLAGGVLLTFEEDSTGLVFLVFTAQTAGVPFTDASSISNTSGNLSGTLPAGLQVANQSMTARVDVCEFGPSTGGTGNITVGGVTKLATFNTDINQTATDFVTSWAAAYSAVGIDLTSIFNVLFFTAQTPGTDFSPADEITFANVSGDLQANAQTDTPNSSATTAQVSVIQLSGTSGTANVTVDAEVQQIAITTITGHTLAWSTFGDSESLPLLQLVANEIAHQYSRSKVLIQMPIQETGNDPTALNIAGHFQDDLNQYSAVNRKFVFNGHGSYKTRFRKWMIDLMEVIP